MTSTAIMARKYSIRVESILWALFDGRDEPSVPRHEPSRLMTRPASKDGGANELFENVLYRV